MDIFKDMPDGITEIISNRMIATTGVSPVGALIPILDTGAIVGIWGNMLYKIAQFHHVTLTGEECTKIITACGSSVLGYLGGCKLLNGLITLIPGVGIFGAMVGNVLLNGYYTYAIGKAFHLMLEDYDINGRTIFEISKILIRLFVPMPSLSTLKGVFQVMKEQA